MSLKSERSHHESLRSSGDIYGEDSYEQAAIRSKTLPFMDSLAMVNETLRLHEEFRDNIKSCETSAIEENQSETTPSVDVGSLSVEPAQSIGPPLITAGMIKRRYPRFCAALTMTEEFVAAILPRSDVWLMQMIEGCYDDAIETSLKSVSAARKRKRCGLQLGALDAFSSVTSRFIARLFRYLVY